LILSQYYRMHRKAVGAALVVALSPSASIGCGSSDHVEHSGGAGVERGAGATVDRALLNDMIPHHESAIEMAEIARRRAEHREVKSLAAAIISDQRAEIQLMAGLKKKVPAGNASSHLGMSRHRMGMSMDTAELARERPFDRAFIDAMVPHHQGAVHMARRELASGKNPEVRRLARRIIKAQKKEIADMKAWRKRWYSARPREPARPAPGDAGHMMEH
jgi:uncharacterized protein (DUF305 family)